MPRVKVRDNPVTAVKSSATVKVGVSAELASTVRRSSRHTAGAVTVEPIKANGTLRSGRVRATGVRQDRVLKRKTSSGPGDPLVEAVSNRKKPNCSICGKAMRGHGKKCDPATAEAEAAEKAEAAISRSKTAAAVIRSKHSDRRTHPAAASAAPQDVASDGNDSGGDDPMEEIEISSRITRARSIETDLDTEQPEQSIIVAETQDSSFDNAFRRATSAESEREFEERTHLDEPPDDEDENEDQDEDDEEDMNADGNTSPSRSTLSNNVDRSPQNGSSAFNDATTTRDTILVGGTPLNSLMFSPQERRRGGAPAEVSPRHERPLSPTASESLETQIIDVHSPTHSSQVKAVENRHKTERKAVRSIARRLSTDLAAGKVLSSSEVEQLRVALEAYEGKRKPVIDHFLTAKDKLPTHYHQRTYKTPLGGGVKATPNGAVWLPLFRNGERELSTHTNAHMKKHRHERFNAFAQKGDSMAEAENDQIWVFAFAVPKSGAGELREWSSPAVQADAPELCGHLRKTIFDFLNPHRQQAVRERAEREEAWRDQLATMKTQTAAADGRAAILQEQIEHMKRENARLKWHVVKQPKQRRVE